MTAVSPRSVLVTLATCSVLFVAAPLGVVPATARVAGGESPPDDELNHDQRRARSGLLKLSDLPRGWGRVPVDGAAHFADPSAVAEEVPACEQFFDRLEQASPFAADFRAFAEKGVSGNERVEQTVMVWPSVASASDFVQSFGGTDDVRCRVKTLEILIPSRLADLGFEDVDGDVEGRRRPDPKLGDEGIRIALSLAVTDPEPMMLSWDAYLVRVDRAVTEVVFFKAGTLGEEVDGGELLERAVARLTAPRVATGNAA